MKTKVVLGSLVLLIAASSSAGAAPLEALVEHGCDEVFTKLLTDYLETHETLVSIYEDRSGTDRRLDGASFTLCKAVDLDPGSWLLRREVTFCNEAGDTVVLFTQGDLWCDSERVLGIDSITFVGSANGPRFR